MLGVESRWLEITLSVSDYNRFQKTMIQNKQSMVPQWADPESISPLLDQARQFAGSYIDSLEHRPLSPDEASLQAMNALHEALPENPSDPMATLERLHKIGSRGTVNQTAGRYFGFVNGGMLPVGLAAKWLGDVWDQNTAHYVMSPIDSCFEKFLGTLDCLATSASIGNGRRFRVRTTTANFSGLWRWSE